jgi:hypothetical protein
VVQFGSSGPLFPNFQKPADLFNRPRMIGDSGFHGGVVLGLGVVLSVWWTRPKLYQMKYRMAIAAWFRSFLLKAFVNRVNRRMDTLMVRFWRSTYEVLMWTGSGLPVIGLLSQEVQIAWLTCSGRHGTIMARCGVCRIRRLLRIVPGQTQGKRV